MIRAVIFDLDGVLVSTDELHYKAWKRLAAELGIDGFTRADNQRQRGVSRMASLEVVLEKSPREFTNAEKIALAERKNGMYIEYLGALTGGDVLPGARECVDLLKARGVKLAIGSASRNTYRILEATKLAGLFDAVADGSDVVASKPDPAVFLAAAAKLGIPPSECAVVEDADAGIEAAVNGGFLPIALSAARNNTKAIFHSRDLADKELDWNRILSYNR